MLDRTYNETNSATGVCTEWLNFQVFAEWYIKAIGDIEEDMTLAFDLLDPSVTIYHPNTTTLVPTYIHKILINNTAKGKDPQFPKGVTAARDKHGRLNGSYKAYIRILNRSIYLGGFHSVHEASRAYNAAKVKHVRDMTKKYKHLLTDDAYRALFKWQVPTTPTKGIK